MNSDQDQFGLGIPISAEEWARLSAQPRRGRPKKTERDPSPAAIPSAENGPGIVSAPSQLGAPVATTSESTQLSWITNYIWGIADDVPRDLYVRGKYRDVILPMRYVTRQSMTNASLRERLGIDAKNIATASRLLGEAAESGLIVIANPDVGTRIRSCLPFWAAPGSDREGVA